MSLIHSQR